MPDNTILAQPNPLQLATQIEGILDIGGSYFLEGIPQGWNSADYIIPSSYVAGADNLRKTGANGAGEVIGIRHIPARQPFITQFSMNNLSTTEDFSVFVGIIDNLGRRSYFNPYRYPPESQARYYVTFNDVEQFYGDYLIGVNSDLYQIASDGSTLKFLRSVTGQWRIIFEAPIPDDVTYWKFFYNLYHHNNYIYTLRVRVDDAVVPVTTDNSTLTVIDGGRLRIDIRAINATRFGVEAAWVGNGMLELANEHIANALRIPITSSTLYLKPVGKECGASVVTGETVQFQSNGGNGGIFQASGGTILSDLKWQASFSTGIVNFTYTIDDVTAQCSLNVVNKLGVNGVDSDGYYPDLAQGEIVQFVANCPSATYRCTNYPNLVTTTGRLVAPTDAQNSVFGEKEAIIKVTGCGQTYTFRVRIQPMFPSPQFCGPVPFNWDSPLIKDFLPTTLTMTGGTTQVKNRNDGGISTWILEYQNLTQQSVENCTCPTTTHNESCSSLLETAARLDAFYNQVKYVKYFSVLDYHSEIVYKYVRLTSYKGKHNLFKTEQSRSLTMRQEGNVLFD